MNNPTQAIVTGCQRSGTRFYAKYLAELHDCAYIDETCFTTRDYELLLELLPPNGNWVIHGPALKHHVEKLKEKFPNLKVTWMVRDTAETILSMRKLDWERFAHLELSAMVEITRRYWDVLIGLLKESYTLPVLEAVVYLSMGIGAFYVGRGVVDELLGMSELESFPGFVKTTTVRNDDRERN